MNIILIFLIILVWLIMGTLAFGYDFAYFQRKYPEFADKEYKKDFLWSLITGYGIAPISLIVVFVRKEYKYGLKFK